MAHQSRRQRQRLQQSTCSPAPREAVENKSAYKKLATLASGEHGDGPPELTTNEGSGCSKALQPCTADSGRNASVTKLATLASSEHGNGLGPKTKTAAAAKHLQPCTADSGRNPSVAKLATLASGERARRRPIRADDERQRLQQSTCTALHRAQRWE